MVSTKLNQYDYNHNQWVKLKVIHNLLLKMLNYHKTNVVNKKYHKKLPITSSLIIKMLPTH